MKRVVLASLSLVAVAVVVWLAFWSGKDAAPGPGAGSAPGGSAAASDTSAALAKDPAVELEHSAGDGAREEADAPPVEASAPSGARWVRGRVQAPDGCEDGERRVYALAREGTWPQLAGELDPDRKDDGTSEVEAAFGSLEETYSDAADQGPVIVSSAEVEPDGTFRLWFPADARRGWIGLGGRYQFVLEARAVDFAGDAGAEVVLRAECGGAVRVRVVLPEGIEEGALAHDEVARVTPGTESMRSGNPASSVRRSARIEDGSFTFGALPVGPRYSFQLAPERLAAVEAPVEDLRAAQVKEITVRLRRGATVRGRVVSPERAPVAGAAVSATTPGQWFGFDDRAVRRGTTDAEGQFELLAVQPGRLTLRADHEAWLESPKAELQLVDGGAHNDVVLTLEGGSTITGSVTWADGRPANDVDVRVSFDLNQMAGMGAFNALRGGSGKGRSNAEGAFTVGGLGAGPFTVSASAPPPVDRATQEAAAPAAADSAGAATAADAATGKGAKEAAAKRDKSGDWRARADSVKPGTTGLALVLRAPIGLKGLVVDELAAPVPAFTLYAQRIGTGMMATFGQTAREQRFTAPDGRFLLVGLTEGTWKLTAAAEGFAPCAPVELEFPRDETREDLTIVLPRAGVVRGTVREPNGTAIAGAEVQVDTGGPDWQQFLERGPKAPKAKSADDGTFELGGLRPVAAKLTATARGWAESVPVAVDLATERELDDVVIVLRRGATLTGEVFDDLGRHAVGWMVQITDTGTFDQQMTFTDGRGEFRMEHLPPGSRQLVAMPAGSRLGGDGADDAAPAEPASGGKAAEAEMMGFVSKMKMGTADLVDGEETHVVLGAPPKDPVKVTGRVTHAGEPFADALVSFVRQGKNVLGGGLKSTSTNGNGEYNVQLNEPGEYDVSVQKFSGGGAQQNLVEFARAVPDEKEARLDFELPTARISGRVVDDEKKPLSGARVSLVVESGGEAGTMWGGQYNETATDSEGRYDIPALRPGKYTVLAGGLVMGGMMGDSGGVHGREAKSGLVLSEGEWMKDVDFRLKLPGTIDVTVVDETGAPVTGAAVFARTRNGELVERFSMFTTGADGLCKYGGLAPGRYTLIAREGVRTSAESAEVEVRSNEHSPARVVLSTGTYIVVNVVDAEQKPLRAALSVRDEQGREVGAMVTLAELMQYMSEGAGSDDERRIGPLPAGKYRVHATLSDGRTVAKPVTLSGQGERKLNIRF